MTDKKDVALKLALEALKMCRALIRINIERLVPIESPNPWFFRDVDHAIRAIREELDKQPAKEKAPQSANCKAPGWISSDHARGDDCTTEQPYPDNFIEALMYDVAKRDSEAQQDYWQEEARRYAGNADFWRGKYEEATAQQQQEPVAWATRMGEYAHIKWGAKRPEYPLVYEIPLYTSPPASKPWVGLTDEEIEQCMKQAYATVQGRNLEHAFARAIEAKLREKNA